MITNATGKRNFFKMKHPKNVQRSTMAQERLDRLALMATENDVLNLQLTDVLEKKTFPRNYAKQMFENKFNIFYFFNFFSFENITGALTVPVTQGPTKS